MTPGRSPAFKAGERAGNAIGLLICAILIGLMAVAAWLAILTAFRAL